MDDEDMNPLITPKRVELKGGACCANDQGVCAPSLRLVAAVLVWYCGHAYSAVITGALIRDLLQDFPLAHLTVTVFQQTACVLMSYLYTSRESFHMSSPGCDLRKLREEMSGRSFVILLLAGLCQALGTAGTNATMASAGATMTQIFKVSEPLFTAVLQYAVLSKAPKFLTIFALATITIGLALTSVHSFENMHPVTRHMLPAICACTSLPLMRILTKVSAFPRMPSGAHTLLLISMASVLPTAGIAIFAVCVNVAPPPRDARFLWSAISFNAYQLASLTVLHELDVVSHSVGNALKRIFVICISAFALGGDFSFYREVGVALCVAGTLLHATATLRETER